MKTEDLFENIKKNDDFLSNFIMNPTERIRVSVEMEILKVLNKLLNDKKPEA